MYYLTLGTQISLAYVDCIDNANFVSVFKLEGSNFFELNYRNGIWVNKTKEMTNLYNALFILKAGAISVFFDDFIHECVYLNDLYYYTTKCQNIEQAYKVLMYGRYKKLARALLTADNNDDNASVPTQGRLLC
jgi:hypothetical protein